MNNVPLEPLPKEKVIELFDLYATFYLKAKYARILNQMALDLNQAKGSPFKWRFYWLRLRLWLSGPPDHLEPDPGFCTYLSNFLSNPIYLEILSNHLYQETNGFTKETQVALRRFLRWRWYRSSISFVKNWSRREK